jgi:hypothetical protein
VKTAAVFAAIAVSLTLTATLPARPATGMEAMRYYVGTWSCIWGAIGEEPYHFTSTYTMSDGILRTWISSKGYAQSGSITYDSKNHRYINSAVGNDGTWYVAYATISGRTESSIDRVTSDGALGRLIILRTSSTSFSSTVYSAVSGGKVVVKAACRRL